MTGEAKANDTDVTLTMPAAEADALRHGLTMLLTTHRTSWFRTGDPARFRALQAVGRKLGLDP